MQSGMFRQGVALNTYSMKLGMGCSTQLLKSMDSSIHELWVGVQPYYTFGSILRGLMLRKMSSIRVSPANSRC